MSTNSQTIELPPRSCQASIVDRIGSLLTTAVRDWLQYTIWLQEYHYVEDNLVDPVEEGFLSSVTPDSCTLETKGVDIQVSGR